MASLPSDGLEDLLFEFYKKEVLKPLITKMTPKMVKTLQRLKDGGPGTSDIGDCKLRLQSFLASFVAVEVFHTSIDLEFSLSGLNSRLESMFGSVLSKEVISGIVGVFAYRCSKTPRMHEELEKLVVDLLKFLVDSSCIKSDDCEVITPRLKRNYVTGSSPADPAKCIALKRNPIEHPSNIDAKVLFPEVQEIPVVTGPSKTCKEPIEWLGLLAALETANVDPTLVQEVYFLEMSWVLMTTEGLTEFAVHWMACLRHDGGVIGFITLFFSGFCPIAAVYLQKSPSIGWIFRHPLLTLLITRFRGRRAPV